MQVMHMVAASFSLGIQFLQNTLCIPCCSVFDLGNILLTAYPSTITQPLGLQLPSLLLRSPLFLMAPLDRSPAPPFVKGQLPPSSAGFFPLCQLSQYVTGIHASLRSISFDLGKEKHIICSDQQDAKNTDPSHQILLFYPPGRYWTNVEQFYDLQSCPVQYQGQKFRMCWVFDIYLFWLQLILREKEPQFKCYMWSGIHTNKFLLFSFNSALGVFLYNGRGQYNI